MTDRFDGKDFKDMGELLVERIGFDRPCGKETLLSAVDLPVNSYQWAKLRRGCSQYGVSLREISPLSGDWIVEDVRDAAGMIEEAQNLRSTWYKNIDGDVQALIESVADPDQLILKAVDRGHDPYRILYLTAANGASLPDIQRMAGMIGELREHIPGEQYERHEKIMGLLTSGGT